MSESRPPTPTRGTDVLFTIVIALLAVTVPFANLAWAGGNLATLLSGTGPGAGYAPTDALLYPGVVWADTPQPHLDIGRWGLPATVYLLAATAGLWWRHRRRSHGEGPRRRLPALASASAVHSVLRQATARKAAELRPSLAGTSVRKLSDSQIGIRLGTLAPGSRAVFAGYEDVMVCVMAPRSGKTSALAIPAILSAPGAVVLTSNKAGSDAYAVTLESRSRSGQIWTFDPQQIAHARQEMWWNILSAARTPEGAYRLAGHFVSATINEGDQDFWSKSAQNTLASMFLAAALADRPVTDVLAWLANPSDRTPIDLLKDIGEDARADQLEGTVTGATETRDGIFETSRQLTACLLDPATATWVTDTRNRGTREFRPDEFVKSHDTLYLLSKDGGGGASAVIAAAADAVLTAATREAERLGGRLDPPLLCVLDEAANICRIADLPDLYSHLGSRGILPLTILQSYRQGQRVWGDAGMDALWSAATVKLVGAGIDDPDFADRLSRMIGDHEVQTVSQTHTDTGRSTSVGTRTERRLPPDAVRALPKGQALLLATGQPIALLTLRPWYRQKGSEQLAAESRHHTARITQRAVRSHTGQHRHRQSPSSR